MMDARLDVADEREFKRRIRRLPTKIQKQVARKTTRETLRPLHRNLRSGAPRKTGRYAKSIKLRAMKRSRKRVGSRITTDAPHGPSVEFGNQHQEGSEHQRKTVRQTKGRMKQRAIAIAKRQMDQVSKSL